MRILDSTRFPHPVLCDFTDDYSGGKFEFIITSVEEDISSGQVSIFYEFEISEENIKNLVVSGVADVGFFITCSDTYFSRYISTKEEKSKISFSTGSLNDRVQVRPLIITRENITNFSSKNMHPEFSEQDVSFPRNEVIACGEEIIFTVGRKKLAPMETIFSLGKSDELRKGEISVNTEGNKIGILVNGETFNKINSLRGSSAGRAILLNSVYLPVVMEVLSEIKGSPDELAQKRWYQIFCQQCTKLGINIQDPDLLRDAQKLLTAPFTKIESCKELFV